MPALAYMLTREESRSRLATKEEAVAKLDQMFEELEALIAEDGETVLDSFMKELLVRQDSTGGWVVEYGSVLYGLRESGYAVEAEQWLRNSG